MNTMPISELIEQVTEICKKNGVKRLDLFGSFATGTSTPTSDIDFVVYGCNNLIKLETDLEQIETLRKIDIFDYDSIHNEFLREDIHRYHTFCKCLNNLEKVKLPARMQMLKVRNQLAHDYDGSFACEMFADIVNVYCPLFEKFRDSAAKYYE